ncbi:Battenin [Bagarius yarrelli]|uniref:Battenin n=1 Tax=Bagarius yarrelli TaxID=175774 RepID=A0A556TND8_BAGYA|nr:Battenin [Bagarius yarrelli]
MDFRTLCLVFILFAQVCGKAPLNTKIVGGQNAKAGSWPWQVSLQESGSHFCGGSLINKNWILSAAHCFSSVQARKVTVKLGLHTQEGNNSNSVSLSVSEIHNHPNYSEKTNNNDIAVLKLSSPVTFTDFINPICLASNGSTFFTDALTWVTGWGRINSSADLPSPGTLQEVQVPIIGNRKCNCLYGVGAITDQMMCAGLLQGGKDSCQGDSGGPLVIKHGSRWVQAGIVSFGQDCALKDFPGVYARISMYQDWIDKIIATNLPGYFRFTSSGSNSDNQVSCGGLPAVIPPTVAPLVCGKANLNSVSSTSGPLATAGAWPWIASLQLNGTHVCGATLIAEKFVMSSANCFAGSKEPSDWIVKLGRLNLNSSDTNEVAVTVDNITFSNVSTNNIAVLKLSTAPPLSDNIQPICVDLNNSSFATGTQCWAAGWGSGGGVQQTLQQFNTTTANCDNSSSSNSICINAIQLEQAVLLADILPTLLIKLTAPFVIHKVPYGYRILVCVATATTSFLVVSFSSTVGMSILGVIFASVSSGLGELSFLSLTVYFSSDVLSGWGSGTGGAGVAGAVLYSALTQAGLSPRVTLLIMLTVPAVMMISYFFLLDFPPSFPQWKSRSGFSSEEDFQEQRRLIVDDDDDENDNDEKGREDRHTEPLTFSNKLQILKGLLKFIVPLSVVYFAEYFINQGLCVNAGVLLISVYYQFWPNVFFVFGVVLYEGLLGGAAYVNIFYLIRVETGEREREFAMSAASVGDSIGIALSAVPAIPIHNYFCSL